MKVNKSIFLILLVFGVAFNPAFAHKPIQSDGTNTSFEAALLIPDHKISWAIYEELSPSETKFYKFTADAEDSFYASIVIPKLEKFENYAPTLALISEEIGLNSIHKIDAELPSGGIIAYNYDGEIPSTEFYEPFTQTTYWERQEIRITIPSDGEYYIVVSDSQEMTGKYSLAIGVIEDFSMLDFFTVLPAAWFQTKLFFEDYTSILITFGVLLGIPSSIIVRKVKVKNKIKIEN